MTLELEILINQFGQGIYEEGKLLHKFKSFEIGNKRKLLRDIENLIIQSKVTDIDIDEAISKSGLKPTFTPCVIAKNGLNYGNFKKIINLPEGELTKSFKLLIYLFKEGYSRRYLEEKGSPNKWWYWDLSDTENLKKIKQSKV